MAFFSAAGNDRAHALPPHAALLPHPELFKDGIPPNAEGAALIAKAVNEALAAKVPAAK